MTTRLRVGRRRLQRTLAVWINGHCAGHWSVDSRGNHQLVYERSWIASLQGRPLSLSLPFPLPVALDSAAVLAPAGGRAAAGKTLRGARVHSFFDHLLPGTPPARLRLQQLFGVASPEAFDLLSALGRDCAGAVQLLPLDQPPGDVQRVEGEALDERDLVRLLDALAADPAVPLPGGVRLPAAVLPSPHAGTALLWHQHRWCVPMGSTPSTHVWKLPLGVRPGGAPEYGTSLENEWLCVRLLQEFGFDVPPARIESVGAHRVLVTERSDRRWVDDGWWARLPTEDLCQATGTPAAQAAESAGGPGLASLLELLRGSDRAAQDRERLLAAVVVLWMLAVPDVSAKCFALRLLPGGRSVLAPLQGVLSAWPVVGRHPRATSLKRLQLGLAPSGDVHTHDQVTAQVWLDAARRHALGSSFETVLHGLAQWAERAIERVDSELPDGFPTSVSGPVFEGVRRTARVLAVG